MKQLRTLERKYIPNVRHKSAYKAFKTFVFSPVVLCYTIAYIIKWLLSKVVIKRKGKSDLVLNNIIAGWVNLVVSYPVTERIAMQRANICAECPSAQFVGGLHTIVVDNKTTQVRGLKCGECGCPLSAKVRSSNDYCPLGKW